MKLECNIITGAFTPSLFYAVSWLYSRDDPSGLKALVKLDHTGLLKYPQVRGLEGLQGRLRLSRPTQSSFCLHIQRSHEEDGGTYKCLIEQFHLDNEGQWQQKASESAGPVVLTVRLPGRTSTLYASDIHYRSKVFHFCIGRHYNQFYEIVILNALQSLRVCEKQYSSV